MKNLKKILALGIGGFIGSNLRYWITYMSGHIFGKTFPHGTLIVNILGCFLLGFLTVYGSEVVRLDPHTKLLLGTGMLGALTTFSTFSNETFILIKDGNLKLGFLNIVLNLLIGLSAIWLGVIVAKKFA